MNSEHEPLKPDPKWRQINSDHYTSTNVSTALKFPPAAYAAGFEDGAFALGRLLWTMFKERRSEAAVKLLSTYDQGTAHPALDWENESPR